MGITGYQLAYQSNFSDDESDPGSGSGGEFVGATAGDDDTAVVKRLDFDGGGDLKVREFGEMGFGLGREHLNRGFGLRIRGDGGRVHVARAASMVGRRKSLWWCVCVWL